MNIKWNEVTWYSKLIAVIMAFIILLFGIYIGMLYQTYLDSFSTSGNISVPYIKNTTGTVQPTTSSQCGGNIANARTCSTGYHCLLGAIPDAGGNCVKDGQ